MKIAMPDGSAGLTIFGEGRPLVLLHSLLADGTSFDLITGALSRDFRVIVLDLPGFGESSTITGGLADFADWVAAAIQRIAPNETPAVIGNGFGAFVALQMAIRHPGLASRLILASCGVAFTEEGRAAFRAMSAAAAANGLEAISGVAMRRLFAPAFQDANPELMTVRRAAFLRTDKTVFQAACAALSTLDLRDDLGQTSIPVLVLAGDGDEATPPAMAKELASLLPGARLTILPGCAHVPQLQMPEAFLSAIGDFIGIGACERCL